MKKVYLIIMVIITSLGNLFAQVNLDSGLVAYYPFNGNANDESGNGNNGIVIGATLTTDRFGNDSSAYDFDGEYHFIYINYSPTLDLSDGMAITAWINANQIPSNATIFSRRFGPTWCSNPYVDYDLQIVSSLNGAHTSVTIGGTRYETNSGLNSITVGNWYFIAATYDGETIKIYIDGQFKNQNTAPSGPIDINDEIITIGAANSGANNYFNGTIDDVRIYNRSLTVEEIDSLFGMVVGINPASITPRRFTLEQNYPNPFNPGTTIKYTVQHSSHVQLKIYNILGQTVRTLVEDYSAPGEYAVLWDGKDDTGKAVASGNYFYRIKVDEFTSIKRMIHLK